MVTPRVTLSKAFNSADPLPNPPENTFPRPLGFYPAPLQFTGPSSYYGFPTAGVIGVAHPGEIRELRGASKEQIYDFSLPVASGPAWIQLFHFWINDDASNGKTDEFQFEVYVLTPPS
jgi:hypothetical protein